MTHKSAVRLLPALALFASSCLTYSVSAQTATESALPESGLPDHMAADAAVPPAVAEAVQTVSPPAPDLIPNIDPIALYGDSILFDVYRKGSKIGTHKATFTRNGSDLTVTSQMELAVDVLFFTAYRFSYESTEVWRDDKLLALAATVDDNGKLAKTTARLEDGLLKIDGPRGTSIASSWVFPTNHWHRGQANSGTILNTLNGKLNKVEVQHRGIERVVTAQGSIDAEHLEYTGQLRDTDVWYDAKNRWVKMLFKAKDGSRIEYRCRQCGLAPGEPATVAIENAPPTVAPAATQQEAAEISER